MSVNTPTSPGTDTTQGTNPLSDAGQQAGESATHIVDRAADLGFRQADRGKEQAAEGISHVAESIRRVGTDMEAEQPQVADLAQTAAEQADRLASYLRETDARQMLHTVEGVARRQPILFLGGAFLLGLAASRLLKVAADDGTREWRGYGGSYGSDSSYSYTAGYRSSPRTGSMTTEDI